MSQIVRQDTQNIRIRFFLTSKDSDEVGIVGLSDSTDGLAAAYIRDNDPTATPIALTSWKEDHREPGAFREIDRDMMPGLYELELPDEVCRSGARCATVMVNALGISNAVVHIDLVAYDPYDSHALGLACLSREHRHQIISSAFREVVPDIVDEFRPRTNPE